MAFYYYYLLELTFRGNAPLRRRLVDGLDCVLRLHHGHQRLSHVLVQPAAKGGLQALREGVEGLVLADRLATGKAGRQGWVSHCWHVTCLHISQNPRTPRPAHHKLYQAHIHSYVCCCSNNQIHNHNKVTHSERPPDGGMLFGVSGLLLFIIITPKGMAPSNDGHAKSEA